MEICVSIYSSSLFVSRIRAVFRQMNQSKAKSKKSSSNFSLQNNFYAFLEMYKKRKGAWTNAEVSSADIAG